MATARSVFISYAHDDKPFVNPFAAALVNFGLNVWQDDKDVGVGDNIVKSVYEGIRAASHFCCIISASSIRSAWVEDELTFAKVRQLSDRDLRIVPVLIDEVEIPDYLKAYLCAHLESRDLSIQNAEFLRILKAFGTDLTHYEKEILIGERRKRLFQQCERLSYELGEFRDILLSFDRDNREHSSAWLNQTADPPRTLRTPRGSQLRRTTYASDARIRHARQSATQMLQTLARFADVLAEAIDQLNVVWNEVDPSHDVIPLHRLLYNALDQASGIAKTIAETSSAKTTDDDSFPWWVREKMPRWIASLPKVEAAIKGASELLESWARFDPPE